MSSDDLAFMPATTLAAAIRSRKLSPVEVTRAILERIERLNPRLNAYLTVDGEGAMQAARRAEQAVVDGAELGPLHGVPVSVKDLVCTRGLRTTFGSLLHQEYVPDHDAGAVERLREAGAIILGKTNTPEFGLMGTTENRLGEPCRNPWNPERTSGGSSGGAGSAVAAGLGPLALGTDGGGSVRIPSGFCGVFGLKPTFGRVPHHSDFGGWGTLSVTGPIARTVADAALMLDVMVGPHPEDPYAVPAPRRPFRQAMKGDLHGLRAAWSGDLGYGAVDPEVRRTAEAAARRFADFGCIVEEDHPGIEDPLTTGVFINLAATYYRRRARGRVGGAGDPPHRVRCCLSRLRPAGHGPPGRAGQPGALPNVGTPARLLPALRPSSDAYPVRTRLPHRPGASGYRWAPDPALRLVSVHAALQPQRPNGRYRALRLERRRPARRPPDCRPAI